MKTLLFMFITSIAMCVWVFFNGYPNIYFTVAFIGLFGILWIREEVRNVR